MTHSCVTMKFHLHRRDPPADARATMGARGDLKRQAHWGRRRMPRLRQTGSSEREEDKQAHEGVTVDRQAENQSAGSGLPGAADGDDGGADL